jgi:hypothetical protein
MQTAAVWCCGVKLSWAATLALVNTGQGSAVDMAMH